MSYLYKRLDENMYQGIGFGLSIDCMECVRVAAASR